MAARLGIGVTTFDRLDRLRTTLERIARHTTTPHVLVVADDGSSDGTPAELARLRIPHVAGPNRGVAWNKNRALFYLHALRGCDPIILIEDDTYPVADGWERTWMEAAHRWGHANYAGEWVRPWFRSGEGTLEAPVVSTMVPGVCSCFSARALDVAGYMDTRFRRYGFEHGEHTQRLLRAGFGGVQDPDGFFLLASELCATEVEAQLHAESLPENQAAFTEIRHDFSIRRRAWRTTAEMRILFAEMRAAGLYHPQASLAVLASTRAWEARVLAGKLWRRLRR